MKSILTACMITFLSATILAGTAFADAVEGSVRDASGKLLYGEIISDADIPGLVDLVGKGGPVAEQAKEVLAKFGPRAVPALLDALKSVGNKAEILDALARISDERIVEPVSGYIADKDRSVNSNAMAALRMSATSNIPGMVALMGRTDTRKAAIDVMSYSRLTEKDLGVLRADTASANPLIRSGVVYLLGWHKDTDSEQDIVRLMDDPDAGVRSAAVEAYKYLYIDRPEKYDYDTAAKHLADADPAVRASAAWLLAGMDDNRVAPAMLKLLETETDHDVLTAAVNALADRRVEDAAFPLMKLFNPTGQDTAFQATVAYALGEIKAREAVPYLAEPFEKGLPVDDNVAREAISSLAKIGERVELGPFMKYLQPGPPEDTATDQTFDLIDAVAKPGDEAVIKALEEYRKKTGDNERVDELLNKLK